MVPVHFPLVFGQDQGNIAEKAEGSVKIDPGLLFDKGDDETGGLTLEVDPLDGVRIAAILEEGEETLGYILNIAGGEVIPDIQGDIVPEKLDKEGMVPQDDLKAVVFAVMNGHTRYKALICRVL
jgi:hypothetical protein